MMFFRSRRFQEFRDSKIVKDSTFKLEDAEQITLCQENDMVVFASMSYLVVLLQFQKAREETDRTNSARLDDYRNYNFFRHSQATQKFGGQLI